MDKMVTVNDGQYFWGGICTLSYYATPNRGQHHRSVLFIHGVGRELTINPLCLLFVPHLCPLTRDIKPLIHGLVVNIAARLDNTHL